MSSLASGETAPHQLDLNAPAAAGTYYYGVGVESVANESNTANNYSTAITLTVENLAPVVSKTLPAQTLVVGNLTVVDVAPYFSDPNQDVLTYTASSEAPELLAVEMAGLSDSRLNINPLATGDVTITVEVSDGEFTATQTLSVSVTGTSSPDLIVKSISLIGEATLVPGDNFRLNTTVQNQGIGESDSTTLRYYRSSDATISDSDTEVETDDVGALDANAKSDESETLTAPSKPGIYYYGVCVDSVTGESDTNNNCSQSVTITVQQPAGTSVSMYWTDWDTNKIQRANLDGSNVQDLVTTGLGSPYGIALDVAAGKMYWADAGLAKIQRANLNGSNVQNLIPLGLSVPICIALDVAGGKMYWTDRGTGKIQRANLDDSNVEDLVTTGLNAPFGITLGTSLTFSPPVVAREDVNNDGVVDAQDVVLVDQKNLDLNDDGVSDIADILLVVEAIGNAGGAPAARL